MTADEPALITPVLLKRGEQLVWPDGASTFYAVTADGLFLCRDHEFFQSCVKTDRWPAELGPQKPFLRSRFPKLGREDFERVVGFFHLVAESDQAEAGVLLVWDRVRQKVEVLVPPQVAVVEKGWQGKQYPIGLHYEASPELPEHKVLLGDIHSHVHSAAYASGTDVHDEMHRPGLHIVVGRLQDDPPDIYVAAVVDGGRFSLPQEAVLEGFESRNLDVPQDWLDKVEVDIQTWEPGWGWGSTGAISYGTAGAAGVSSGSGVGADDRWAADRDDVDVPLDQDLRSEDGLDDQGGGGGSSNGSGGR